MTSNVDRLFLSKSGRGNPDIVWKCQVKDLMFNPRKGMLLGGLSTEEIPGYSPSTVEGFSLDMEADANTTLYCKELYGTWYGVAGSTVYRIQTDLHTKRLMSAYYKPNPDIDWNHIFESLKPF